VRAQVTTYLDCLDDLGALVDDRFVVQCATTVNDNGARNLTILVVFHPVSSSEPISMTLHVNASGCRVGSAAFVPSSM
jgi:hypothetical protein